MTPFRAPNTSQLNNCGAPATASPGEPGERTRYRARRFWLSDLGSTNGTFINGEQVAEQALRDGDTISLGGLELVFKEA